MRRIGIDVGGTNTDAVLLEDDRVVHATKTPTTLSNAFQNLAGIYQMPPRAASTRS